MKNIAFILLTIILAFALLASCRKKDDTDTPVVNTLPVSEITDTSAITGGEIKDNGNLPIFSRGVVWSKNTMPTLESNDGLVESDESTATFSVYMTGLDSGTTYHVRAFAENSEGTAYGTEQSFQTLLRPVFSFTRIEGFSDIAAFLWIRTEFGSCTERGIYFSLSSPAHVAGGKIIGTMSAYTDFVWLLDLTPLTTYYVEAYAITSFGEFYGEEISFITNPPISGCFGCETDSVTDVDGNIYPTVKIGEQWWMAKNIRTTKYSNGDAIPKEILSENLITGAYCWYNNDSAETGKIYGALYNWYTVADPRQVCPAGWHVPTPEEFNTLSAFLGGDISAGGRMKEAGTEHWTEPNICATNESGFNALPGGHCAGDHFEFLGVMGVFWLSLDNDETNAWNFKLQNSNSLCSSQCCDSKSIGHSIRCIKD